MREEGGGKRAETAEGRGTVHPPGHAAHDPKHTARWLGALLALTLLYFAGHLVHDRWQKRREQAHWAHDMTGGDPARGRVLARRLGCGGCHTIPGVDGAHGLVGPPLAGIADRVYVGGVVVNSPDNLVLWIMNPKAFDPKTAMPAVGATEEQARHVAAYLLTLR